jgi:hypothetical protein
MENKIEFDYLNDREKTIVSFDHDYNEKIIDIIANLNTMMFNFTYFLFKAPNQVSDEKDSIFLLFRSIDYLFSAINLMRQRACFETLTILRLVIETSSTAFHISKDKEKLKEFKAGKYKSTKSINFAKKYIPRLGEIWGALSQSAVHVNPRHGIYAYIKDEYLVEEGDIRFGEKEKNEKQDYMLITLTKLSYNIIYRFFELIFYQDAKDKGMDVKYNKESGLIKIAKKTEEIIDELLAELKKIANNTA